MPLALRVRPLTSFICTHVPGMRFLLLHFLSHRPPRICAHVPSVRLHSRLRQTHKEAGRGTEKFVGRSRRFLGGGEPLPRPADE